MSASSNMSRRARRGAKEVRSAARHLRRTAEAESNGMLHTVQRVGNEAVGAVKEGYDDLRETASDYLDSGRQHVRSLEKNLQRQVKQHPMTTILAAVGLGFLAGLIFSRR